MPQATGFSMRKIVVMVGMLLASGSAMASSVEHIQGNRTSNGSIISVACSTCPPPTQKIKPDESAATELPTGTQRISVRDVDGRKEMLRTEAWLGGSPVTYISHNPAWFGQNDAEQSIAAKDALAGIDNETKTSATGQSENPPSPPLATTPSTQPSTVVDFNSVALRP